MPSDALRDSASTNRPFSQCSQRARGVAHSQYWLQDLSFVKDSRGSQQPQSGGTSYNGDTAVRLPFLVEFGCLHILQLIFPICIMHWFWNPYLVGSTAHARKLSRLTPVLCVSTACMVRPDTPVAPGGRVASSFLCSPGSSLLVRGKEGGLVERCQDKHPCCRSVPPPFRLNLVC